MSNMKRASARLEAGAWTDHEIEEVYERFRRENETRGINKQNGEMIARAFANTLKRVSESDDN